MADELLTAPHGGLASIFFAVGAGLGRFMKKGNGGGGESKAEKELRELREKLVEARFDRLEELLTTYHSEMMVRLGKLENRLETAEKDINSLWREHRANAGRE